MIDFFQSYVQKSDSEEEKEEEKVNQVEREKKIVENIVGCDIEKCIKGTSLYIPKQKNNLIKEIINPKKNEYHKIFYKSDGKIGYIEVFQSPELSLAFKISKNISFLFESMDEDKLLVNNNKCFGFRYYNSKKEYCTLLKIGNDDRDEYKFLEKIKEDENIFYNEKLDCFSIVLESIFSRYEKEYNDYSLTLNEGPLYEILGFSHAILFKSNEYCKFHKPYSIDIMNVNKFTNNIPFLNDDKVVHIMPILFDGHISILFLVEKNKRRGCILSDPSHVHSQCLEKFSYIDVFLFPNNMRKIMKLYPEKKIQKFNSCSLWFYFQLLILINYDKSIQKEYKTSIDVINSIRDSSIYFECVKYYQKLFKFEKELIEIDPITEQIDTDYIYFIPDKEYYKLKKVKINKASFINQFVDLIQLFEIKTGQDVSDRIGFKELKVFHNYYEEFIDFILLLKYNINFLILNKIQDNITKIDNLLQEILSKIEALKIDFSENCLNYFKGLLNKKYNVHSNSNPKDFTDIFDARRNIYSVSDKYHSKFENLKNYVENRLKLYPLEVTSKVLFPICGILYHSK